MKNIVILISGNGSNLQAIIDVWRRKKINGIIRSVICNKPNSFGIMRAKNAGISTHILQEDKFQNREEFDLELMKKIDIYNPDLVVLAGYMRILGRTFVTHYIGRLINIHPSLLPKYPGLHTHRQVLKNGDKEHGASVHFVTEMLDRGPIILQTKIPVFSKESEDEMSARLKIQENIVYPIVVKWFTDDRLVLRNKTVWLDGIKLPNQGVCFSKKIS